MQHLIFYVITWIKFSTLISSLHFDISSQLPNRYHTKTKCEQNHHKFLSKCQSMQTAAVTCLPNQNLICWPSQTASYQRLEQFNQNIIDKEHGSGTFDCMHVSIHFEHKLKLTKICGCLAVSLTKICILSIMETCIPRTSFFWNFNSHELNGAVHSVEIYNVYTA